MLMAGSFCEATDGVAVAAAEGFGTENDPYVSVVGDP